MTWLIREGGNKISDYNVLCRGCDCVTGHGRELQTACLCDARKKKKKKTALCIASYVWKPEKQQRTEKQKEIHKTNAEENGGGKRYYEISREKRGKGLVS
jgi:hypothetical protein